MENSDDAFAMLLQEGYQHVASDQRPPRVVLETIIKTIFESVYSRVRAGGTRRLSGLIPHFTFLVLSPFLGPGAANKFIAANLR